MLTIVKLFYFFLNLTIYRYLPKHSPSNSVNWLLHLSQVVLPSAVGMQLSQPRRHATGMKTDQRINIANRDNFDNKLNFSCISQKEE